MGDTLRIGARFPNAGGSPSGLGLANAAQIIESAGYDSLWASDHLAMPVRGVSSYPFSSDGRIPWSNDLAWADAIVALGIAAAVTDHIELGTAVLVAALRSPLVFAKQLATVAVEAEGRTVLGVGVGWLEHEYDAVGVPFSKRGQRLDAWMEVARDVWSGSLSVRADGLPYPNPTEMVCRPVPPAPVPILVGGLSPAALGRAGRLGDGWIGLQPAGGLDASALADSIEEIRDTALQAGRDPSTLRIVLQITESDGQAALIAGRLDELLSAGVNEIIVDPGWENMDQPQATLATLRAAL